MLGSLTFFIRLFCFLFSVSLLSLSLYGQALQPLQLPGGPSYEYDLIGDRTAANPLENIPAGMGSCGTPGWISYALTHQLSKDPQLLAASQLITGKKSLCAVMSEVTMGAGYYLLCNGGNKDLKFIGENVVYLIHINTVKGEMYVAEYQGSTLVEINPVYVGRKWFEPDPEPYENPVVKGNTNCETPIPEPEPEIVSVPNEPETSTLPPVAIILADPPVGEAPFTTMLDGSLSTDPDGGVIVTYSWRAEESPFMTGEVRQSRTFEQAGTYSLSLEVVDDEGERDTAQTYLTVLPSRNLVPPAPDSTPPPVVPPISIPAPPSAVPADTCWMMIYTLRGCDDGIDTVGITPIRVACPGPPLPKVIWTDCCCDQVIAAPDQDKPERLQLAGGPIFNRFRGQLTEYALGVDLQVRYRLGRRQRWAVLLDAGVFPRRRATPLDDRPYKWSPLRDSVDLGTGLPLVWHRGSVRGTARAALGAEFAIFPWLYLQSMAGMERSFQQAEASGPRKDPTNQFVGFDLETIWYEGRVGIRKGHLEIYTAYSLSEENRPFSLIPPNVLGGSHNFRMDKSYLVGISLFY